MIRRTREGPKLRSNLAGMIQPCGQYSNLPVPTRLNFLSSDFMLHLLVHRPASKGMCQTTGSKCLDGCSGPNGVFRSLHMDESKRRQMVDRWCAFILAHRYVLSQCSL